MSSTEPEPRSHIVIVGGGLAGLATAVALADSEVPRRVTLLESRPRLGGRASSFPDPTTGELVDNCQHVSMVCCTNLADLCRRVGTAHLFRRLDAIRFLSPEGRISYLKPGPWPAPLHLTGSFLRANYLAPTERVRVAYGVARLHRWRPDGRHGPHEPVLSFLRRVGQTDRTIRRYWETVLISALNERLDRMDVGHARKVFVDGFLRHRDGHRVEVPTVPLGDLYGTRLATWLDEHQVEVRLGTGVRAVTTDPATGSVVGVRLRDGTEVAADHVVLAVPFDRVAGLLSDSDRVRLPSLAGLDQIEAAPITGVHLWFDRTVCPWDHVATVDRPIHWIFNHSTISGRPAPGSGTDGEQYLQVVISASYDLQRLGRDAIRDLVLREIRAIWPEASGANLLRFRVVTEHGATFAVRPGIDDHRPPQRTAIPGLVLAGDWTRTGWPATMEGAVRSGYHAAEVVLADLGRPQRLIQPDLPTRRLARWTLGRPEPTPQAP